MLLTDSGDSPLVQVAWDGAIEMGGPKFFPHAALKFSVCKVCGVVTAMKFLGRDEFATFPVPESLFFRGSITGEPQKGQNYRLIHTAYK